MRDGAFEVWLEGPEVADEAYADGRVALRTIQDLGRLKAAGGDAQVLNPPDRGIRGNSHMIMQDKNNLRIADLILQWIEGHADKRGGGNE